MRRPLILPSFATTLFVLVLGTAAHTQNASPFDGIWTLDRSQSEFPSAIGFDAPWLTRADADRGQSAGQSQGRGGGGRGRQGGGGRTPLPAFPKPENFEDAKRLQLLTAEARNPPVRQIIVDKPAAVTI